MNDMSSVIIPKSDQINADSLLAGPMTVTIREVQIRGGQEQPVNILLEETELAYRPCKSMSRVLVQAWGADAKAYVGRTLTLYRDPSVKWGGLEVGGIRISHMSHIDGKKVMQLTATKGQRKPHVVMPLVVQQHQPNAGRPTAAQFAANHRAAVDEAATIADLDAIIAEDRRGLAKLQHDNPELFTECQTSQAARRAALSGEGPADSQRGAGFADDNSADVRDTIATNIRSMIESAMGQASWDAASAELDKHEAALPDDVAETLAIDLGAKKLELGL